MKQLNSKYMLIDAAENVACVVGHLDGDGSSRHSPERTLMTR